VAGAGPRGGIPRATSEDDTSTGPAAGDGAGARWRIDDLARLSGTTVDTLRFYQREGLLPPATRRGRSLVYGPEHLQRLERIRDLQARHFTLKGIRALAEEGRLQLLDRLFGPEPRTFTRDELVGESGLEPEVVDKLEEAGLLGAPERHGALSYDGEDLAVLSCLRASLERGMPVEVAVFLVGLYHGQMAELERKLFDTFSIGGSGLQPILDEDALDAFRTLAANDIDAFLEDSCVLLEYLHRRGVKRLVLEAMRMADAVGGSSRNLSIRVGEPGGSERPEEAG
jgi:DNA-binding transcriptional MerR regulator